MPARCLGSAGEELWFCLFLECSGDEHSGSREACGRVDWSTPWLCHLRQQVLQCWLVWMVARQAMPRNVGLALGKYIYLVGSCYLLSLTNITNLLIYQNRYLFNSILPILLVS